MSDITVTIEGRRRRVILAVLCGLDMLDGLPLSEKDKKVEDTEIEHFIGSMSEDERLYASRKFSETFHLNVKAAVARLHAVPETPKAERRRLVPKQGFVVVGHDLQEK